MNKLKSLLILYTLVLTGCASNNFVDSWHSPDAKPMHVQGAKVAAIVMMKGEASRRSAEQTLANELSKRGAIGIPLYMIVSDAQLLDEPAIRAELKKQGIDGAVVMRPVGTETKVSSTPTTMYAGPRYAGFWGGYYGYGWNTAWDPVEIRTDTIVYIETLVYSLKQNELVWGGRSKSTNPSSVDKLVISTAKKVGEELEKLGLIANASAPTN